MNSRLLTGEAGISHLPRSGPMWNEPIITLDFSRKGTASEFQLYGWSDPEDEFTWSDGGESALAIPTPDAPQGFFLELECKPFLPRGIANETLGVLINGQERARIPVADRRHVFAVWVPPLRRQDRSLTVALRHAWCRRPIHFGHPTDTRELAVSVFRVRVLRCASIPQFLDGARQRVAVTPQQDEQGWHSEVERLTGIPIIDFLPSFEMLAGNCEFGFLQRYCGVEPLSLLRFSGGLVPQMIHALDENFAGLEDGGDLATAVADNALKEWLILERRYLLHQHTFQSSQQVDEAAIINSARRRMQFLRRMLLESLDEAHRTFLFVDNHAGPIEEAVALFLALCRHGQHRMLWITATPEPPGSVVEILPGLMHGCIERFAPPDNGGDLSMSGWLNVLVNAWLMQPPLEQ